MFNVVKPIAIPNVIIKSKTAIGIGIEIESRSAMPIENATSNRIKGAWRMVSNIYLSLLNKSTDKFTTFRHINQKQIVQKAESFFH